MSLKSIITRRVAEISFLALGFLSCGRHVANDQLLDYIRQYNHVEAPSDSLEELANIPSITSLLNWPRLEVDDQYFIDRFFAVRDSLKSIDEEVIDGISRYQTWGKIISSYPSSTLELEVDTDTTFLRDKYRRDEAQDIMQSCAATEIGQAEPKRDAIKQAIRQGLIHHYEEQQKSTDEIQILLNNLVFLDDLSPAEQILQEYFDKEKEQVKNHPWYQEQEKRCKDMREEYGYWRRCYPDGPDERLPFIFCRIYTSTRIDSALDHIETRISSTGDTRYIPHFYNFSYREKKDIAPDIDTLWVQVGEQITDDTHTLVVMERGFERDYIISSNTYIHFLFETIQRKHDGQLICSTRINDLVLFFKYYTNEDIISGVYNIGRFKNDPIAEEIYKKYSE